MTTASPEPRAARGELAAPGGEAEAGEGRVLVPEIVEPADPWLVRRTPDSFGAAREADREVAIRRRDLLEQYEAFAAGARRGEGKARERETMERFVAVQRQVHPDLALSRSTLCDWRKAYREGGLPGLLPRYDAAWRRRKQEAGESVPEEIGDLVGHYYLDRNQRKLTVCYEIAKVEAARLYPQLLDGFPSIATIGRYVRRRWPTQAIVLAREGSQALRRQCLPYTEMDPTSYAVMDLWTSDHALCDVWVATPDGKRIRPWVTDWRDKRSTLRVGWLVHEGPSTATILASFAMGVRRHGVPCGVNFDNGLDFSSPAFTGTPSRRFRINYDEPRVKGLLEHLRWGPGEGDRVQVHFTIPREPQGKGSHETQYRIDREWFDKLWDTYCGKDPNSRPEHLKSIKRRKDGLPTLVEFQYLYGRYCEMRNHTPSDAQDLAGRTPAEAFAAAAIERIAVGEAELRLLLLKTTRPLRVQANGIWLFDRWYWSETIARHFGELVYVRYDLDQVGRVYAFTLADRYLDTLERVDLLRVGASEADVRKAKHRKAYVRRIAKEADEVRTAVATNPDLIVAMADARTAGAATAEGRPPTGDDGGPRDGEAAGGEQRAAGSGQQAAGAEGSGDSAQSPERRVVTPFEFAARQIKKQLAAGSRQRAAIAKRGDPLERLGALQAQSAARMAQSAEGPELSEEERAERAMGRLGRFSQGA